MKQIEYRGYLIGPNPCNIAAECDWLFSHKDYDGAPDANDSRCGYGPSIEDCKSQIDDLIEAEGIVTTGA